MGKQRSMQERKERKREDHSVRHGKVGYLMIAYYVRVQVSPLTHPRPTLLGAPAPVAVRNETSITTRETFHNATGTSSQGYGIFALGIFSYVRNKTHTVSRILTLSPLCRQQLGRGRKCKETEIGKMFDGPLEGTSSSLQCIMGFLGRRPVSRSRRHGPTPIHALAFHRFAIQPRVLLES